MLRNLPGTPRPARNLRRALCRAGAALIVPVVVFALAIPAAVSSEVSSGSVTASSVEDLVAGTSSALPFDLPSTTALRSSSRKVFAHYFPPFPLSLDNQDPANDYYQRNYLNPDGEAGKHAAYGGHLRDRPIGRSIRGTSWRVEDMQDEVRQAIGAGIDGFAVDLMVIPPTSNPQLLAVRALMKAAENVDPAFEIMLMLDMSGNVPNLSKTDIAAFLAELGASPAAYRVGGKLVISAFLAERVAPSWYTELFAILATNHGISVIFHPTFLDETPHRAAFAPIMAASGNWGSRNPAWNEPSATCVTCPVPRIKAIQAVQSQSGGAMKWMQPVSIQDERPNQSIFDESQNTQNLRNTWEIAREGDAALVQLTTWNDYTEGTQFAPSKKDGYAWLDLNTYYLTWYKTGVAPAIVRDTIYLTHRAQPWAATPAYPQAQLMRLRGGSPARDTVEALTFLTAPATVTVTVGSNSYSCAAPAGQGVCTVPLSLGTVSAKVVRSSIGVASVTSPHTVTATPYVQDLHYVAASSGRQGTGGATIRLATSTPAAVTSASTPTAAGAGATTATSTTPVGATAATSATATTRTSQTTRPTHRTLRYGSRGALVKKLQKRLGLRQSGYFGKATRAKVKTFQVRRGWRPVGVVGPKTWRALGI